MLNEIYHLLKKELLLEWRQRHAVGGILLYVVSTVFICYLSFKNIIEPSVWNSLFWIIILFASVNASAKSFIQENKGRFLYYYTVASPHAIIISKIIYNVLLIITLSIICLGFYTLFLGNVVENISLFFCTLIAGGFGLASLLTIISAIAAKANNNFTMMAILSFPIIMPLLMVILKISQNAILGTDFVINLKYFITLFALDSIVLILAYLLFPYLWRD